MNDAISTRTTMTLLGWKNNGIKFKCHDFYGGRFLILRNATMNVSAFFQCHFIFSLYFFLFSLQWIFSFTVCRWSDTQLAIFNPKVFCFFSVVSFHFVPFNRRCFLFIFGYNFEVIYLELFYSSIFNSIWCTLVCVLCAVYCGTVFPFSVCRRQLSTHAMDTFTIS